MERNGNEKEQPCQCRAPFLQGDFPFFRFWDAVAQIWNSMMHMQLNGLKMLQFQTVLVPRKVIFLFHFLLIGWQTCLIATSFSERAKNIAIFNKKKRKWKTLEGNFWGTITSLSNSFYKDGTSLTLVFLSINTEQHVFWGNVHTTILSKYNSNNTAKTWYSTAHLSLIPYFLRSRWW